MPDPSPRVRSRRRGVVHIDVGRRSAWLTGAGLAAVLDDLGVPHMRCPHRHQLTCPIDRLDDVIAYLEHRDGRRIEVEAASS